MNTLLQRAYRERRRTLVAAGLAFLAGYIFYMKFNGYIHGMPIPVFTGLFYGFFVGLAALAMGVFLPNLRFTVEVIALSRLLFAIFVWQVPELGQQLLDSPLINATIVVGGAYLLNKLIRTQEQWYNVIVGWLDDTQGRFQDQLRVTPIPVLERKPVSQPARSLAA